MKFEASTTKLSAAISVVLMAIPSRTTNQVLTTVMIEADEAEKKIKLTATDDALRVAVELPAEQVAEGGSACIPGKLFDSTVKKIPGSYVNVSTNNLNLFNIESGEIKSRISGLGSDIFPGMEEPQEQTTFSIEREALYNMIAHTEPCVAKDDMREVLTGACLEVCKGDVYMIGLDGYRMAVDRINNSSSEVFDIKAIIPRKALGVLKKLLSSSDEELVELMFGKNTLSLTLGGMTMQCRLIEGEYIIWRNIVPKTFSTEIIVETDAFRKAIDRALVIAAMKESRLVKFEIADGNLHISTEAGEGRYDENLDVEQHGANLNIAFNISFVTDTLRLMESDSISLNFTTAVAPCVVHDTESMDYFNLLLPVRQTARD